MSIIDLLKTSLYSLKFHKLRAFLTMIGIIIGISSVVTILSIGDGLKEDVVKSSEKSNANKIGIKFQSENREANKKLVEPFEQNDLYTIKNIQGVEKVETSQGMPSFLNFTGGQLSYFNKAIGGTIEDYKEDIEKKVAYGRWFKKGEENKNFIVLEYRVAKELFDNLENGIGKAITMNGINYEVIGILPEIKEFSFNMDGTSNFISKVNKESMKTEDKNSGIAALDVFIKPNYDKKAVFQKIEKALKTSHPNLQGEYKMDDPEEMTKMFEKIIGGITKFIAFVTAISLVVGGIGVMNIMYVSVSERKREIGIRRAIGARQRTILLQFLFEAILVTFIGGLIGILFGFLISKIVGHFLPFKPILTMATFIGATLVSIIEGIIFGIIPAYNACKLDPIKAIYR
ncbi:ABC transporter permease [Clostridium tarantellae]|uniref:FtsX-like permease family protein n=1 Tax=Clostridium tarantellae TaxID=39493 RepID=A0A6I1MQ69_9CLOT|nr:ABC transporter permease [Clostridium tarantellae]MPQ42429.1 FtsX-like permease family protein [Clostridium tarantellae]